jgi:hypothetical protein
MFAIPIIDHKTRKQEERLDGRVRRGLLAKYIMFLPSLRRVPCVIPKRSPMSALWPFMDMGICMRKEC